MIFVTVGTHEQPFDRLIYHLDEWKRKKIIDEDIIMQTGYSTYIPMCCMWKAFFPYQEMIEYIKQARIVITHGGPASFIMPLQLGKIPIVVPRRKKYGEHVNDHQYYFANEVLKRYQSILVVNDIKELEELIVEYDERVKMLSVKHRSNNEFFNIEFEKMVKELFD